MSSSLYYCNVEDIEDLATTAFVFKLRNLKEVAGADPGVVWVVR